MVTIVNHYDHYSSPSSSSLTIITVNIIINHLSSPSPSSSSLFTNNHHHHPQLPGGAQTPRYGHGSELTTSFEPMTARETIQWLTIQNGLRRQLRVLFTFMRSAGVLRMGIYLVYSGNNASTMDVVSVNLRHPKL